MKTTRKLYIALIGICFFAVSCDSNGEWCYKCVSASGNATSKYCLPKSDAESKKDGLESNGYNCYKE